MEHSLFLCNYSDVFMCFWCSDVFISYVYKLVKGNTAILGAGTDAGAWATSEKDQNFIFKNCTIFTYYITKIKVLMFKSIKVKVLMLWWKCET